MLLTAAFFWLFATVLTLSAVAVVTARNPVDGSPRRMAN